MSFGDLEAGSMTSRSRQQVNRALGGERAGPAAAAGRGAAGRGGASSAAEGGESFDRISRQIQSNLLAITNGTKAINDSVKQLGTNKDSTALRESLHERQEETNKLVKQTSDDMKRLEALVSSGDSSEARQRKALKNKLLGNFQSALASYKEAQNLCATKSREFVARARAHSHHEHDHEEDEEQEKAGLLESARRQEIAQLDNEVEFNEELIAEREQGLQDLERDVLMVNEIFRDLALMVKDQEQMLDVIDGNVTRTVENTDKANVQLGKAAHSQKLSRKKLCIILFLVIVLGAVTFAILKFIIPVF